MTNYKQKKKDSEKSIKDFKKDLEGIEERLILAERERNEYLNGWKRAKADFINFKKETEQRTSDLSDIIKTNFIKSLLPILDALEESANNNIEGLKNIKELIDEIFKKEGIKEIKTKEGDEFNPEIHEALEGEGNIVGEIIQKGYKLHSPAGERIIRTIKVKVRN